MTTLKDTGYLIVLDTFEDQLEIDEAVLQANNVAGLIVRMNHIDGGTHIDMGFSKQWLEAAALLRMPYFVYNPWDTWQANLDWMASHMPAEARAVCVDIEVSKTDVTPAMYAAEIASFVAKADDVWAIRLYTGPWFFQQLASWPKTYSYWLARYPLALYPDTKVSWSFAQLHAAIDPLIWSNWTSYTQIGPVGLWQCSGDRLILPGNVNAMDVSVWPNTDYNALAAWLGSAVPVENPLTKRVDALETSVAALQQTVTAYNKRLADLEAFQQKIKDL